VPQSSAVGYLPHRNKKAHHRTITLEEECRCFLKRRPMPRSVVRQLVHGQSGRKPWIRTDKGLKHPTAQSLRRGWLFPVTYHNMRGAIASATAARANLFSRCAAIHTSISGLTLVPPRKCPNSRMPLWRHLLARFSSKALTIFQNLHLPCPNHHMVQKSGLICSFFLDREKQVQRRDRRDLLRISHFSQRGGGIT